MAHFAQLNSDNEVVNVLVVADEDTADEDATEVEAIGVAFLEACFSNDHPEGTTYVQCSYRTQDGEHPNDQPLRFNYPKIGDLYDPDRDVFIVSRPSKGWVLNDDGSYSPPTPEPEDGDYYWNDDSESWELVDHPDEYLNDLASE